MITRAGRGARSYGEGRGCVRVSKMPRAIEGVYRRANRESPLRWESVVRGLSAVPRAARLPPLRRWSGVRTGRVRDAEGRETRPLRVRWWARGALLIC